MQLKEPLLGPIRNSGRRHATPTPFIGVILQEQSMRNTNKPLLNLTARELMSTDVESIPQWMSLPVAARMLSRAHISGAPVVDGDGRCLGVISTTDFMTWAESGEGAAKPASTDRTAHSAWQMVEAEDLPVNLVRRYMTANPVTVPPETPIGELVQKMVDAHSHRVIVVDEENKPLGIISTTDILAAIANSAARKRQLECRVG
jgi:CBS-domain-containing membrane protein